jgi:putative transposase
MSLCLTRINRDVCTALLLRVEGYGRSMGRDLRRIDPNSIYHANSIGSDHGPIVFDDYDREALLRKVAQAAMRYGWEVFAWCIMTSHYHVVLRTTRDGFSRGFQMVNGSHSRQTNRRHEREAHLFQNRPHAEECESDENFVNAVIYVVRNPIAAGMCDHASQWRFSSYRATVGLAEAPPWLNLGALHELFDGSQEFARLVHDGHLPVSDTGTWLR